MLTKSFVLALAAVLCSILPAPQSDPAEPARRARQGSGHDLLQRLSRTFPRRGVGLPAGVLEHGDQNDA